MNLAKFSLLACIGASAAFAAPAYIGASDGTVSTVIDLASGDPSIAYGGEFDAMTRTWTWNQADGVIMNNIVAIKNGTLVIPAGSVVRGQPRDTVGGFFNPGTLLITRSAKLIAQGNASEPIIFTTAATSSTGGRASGSTPAFWDATPKTAPQSPLVAGLNGGVVILGNASTNVDRDGTGAVELFADGFKTATTDDLSSVEGIPTTAAVYLSGDDRFGGFNDNDNSGALTYASIRHGGANLSDNNELNGLTLGGVGSGTTLNNIEIWGNTDDGVEIFGGTVNLSNVAIIAPQDDGLDLDVGYRGTVQNLLVVAQNLTDKLGEWDGSYEGEPVNGFTAVTGGPATATRTPYSMFTIVNATFVGNKGAANFSHGLHIRDQAGVRLVNSIILNASRATGVDTNGNPIITAGSIEIDNRAAASDTTDTTYQFVKGRSYFKGVTLQGTYSTVTDWVAAGSADATIEGLLSAEANQNIFAGNVSFENVPTGGTLPANLRFDPRPADEEGIVADANPVFEDAAVGAAANYTVLPYRGAFNPNATNLWTADWSACDAYGLLVK